MDKRGRSWGDEGSIMTCEKWMDSMTEFGWE